MGTRRLEEMIIDARAQAYSEDYSLTEGWNDNVVANLFVLGLNRLYHKLTQIDNPANIEQFTTDIVQGQQAYDIPMDVFMALRIVDVRYQYGGQTYEFLTLRQSDIQDRFDYPINVPDAYCIRDGQILLSPTPNLTRDNALIVNFQKRMRSLDVRRGRVLSKTDSPVSLTLTFTDEVEGVEIGTAAATYTGNLPGAPVTASTLTLTDGTLTVTDDGAGNLIGDVGVGTNTIDYTTGAYDVTFSGVTGDVTASYSALQSSKNENMQTNAESKLDKVDYICLVDRDGEPIVTKIAVNGYDSDSQVITAESDYTFPAAQLIELDAAIAAGDAVYVVIGEYASTHSELDNQCESFLIEYVIARLLRLQSNSSERDEAKEREMEALDDLVNAYRRYRKSVYPVRWVRAFKRSSYPWGRRGIYG